MANRGAAWHSPKSGGAGPPVFPVPRSLLLSGLPALRKRTPQIRFPGSGGFVRKRSGLAPLRLSLNQRCFTLLCTSFCFPSLNGRESGAPR